MTNEKVDKKEITILIDRLAPINNNFRSSADAVEKVRMLWDMGSVLDDFIKDHKLKLHDLLFQLYDPHSTVKQSYITRDLGSYAYRIFHYFPNKDEIDKKLKGLQKYILFREAIPLLFNEKYQLTDQDKKQVIKKITSNLDPNKIVNDLRNLKKKILPISNPRNQKSNQYEYEREFINYLKHDIKDFYTKFESIPDQKLINEQFGSKEKRDKLVAILMALASDSFSRKIESIEIKNLDDKMIKLCKIARGSSESRARFRKWVSSSNELLSIAEGVHSLSSQDLYISYKNKLE